MKPNEAKDLVKTFYKAKLRHPVLNFVGSKGVGKSLLVLNAVEELRTETKEDIGFLDIRLALDTPEDVSGWPRPTEDSVKYLMADWAKETFKYKNIVLFFDEINRSPLETRQAMFELLSKGSIRRQKINPNYLIVCAMNPDNGNYQVEPLDPAFQRRMVMIAVNHDRKGWLKWAKDTGVNNNVLEYIEANDKMLYKEEEFALVVEPNEDAWTMVGRIIEQVPDLTNNQRFEVVKGIVGQEGAVGFMKYMDTKKAPMSAEYLFKNWPDSKEELLKQKNDAMTHTLESIIEFMDNEKNQKDENLLVYVTLLRDELKSEFASSLLNSASPELATKLHAWHKKTGTDSSWVDGEKFVELLNEEENKKEKAKKSS